MNREDLFYKLYDELLNNGLINTNNFETEYACDREFIKIATDIFKDYYLLDQLHELD